MAYNGRYLDSVRVNYNPDALPAHAEPEKTAAMQSHPPRNSSRNDYYATKPPPPPPAPPTSLRTALDNRYTRSDSPVEYKSPSRPAGGYDGFKEPQRHANGRNNSYEPRDERPRQEHRESGSARSRYDAQQQGGYAQSRPAAQTSRPPPMPRDHTREGLWPMFKAVDKDRSGQLSEEELAKALVNGDHSPFDGHTVKMMIRMFDVDHNGTISFDEFCGLWGFLIQWRQLFDKFDVDHSNTISLNEFERALLAFGYHLSPEYVHLLFITYDTKKRGVLSFDLFVQSCISLKRMTDVFKKYDKDRTGFITLSFEQFLTGSQSLFLFNSISPATDRPDAY